MRTTTRRAAASAAVVLTSALLLTACNSGNGGGSAPSSGSTASAGGAAPTEAPTSGSGGTSGGTSGATTGGTSAATPGTGGGTPGASAAAAGCQNLVATDAVKAAVTSAYEAASHRGHITPRPHQFLYGECGGTIYAATAFDLTPGATYNDQVAAQDDGSTRKYLSLAAGGSWAVIGSDNFPGTAGGCIHAIPADLAKLWGGCPAE
ncbi:putative small secreted protein [Streptacidiphilus sp. MAP12-33]|uniref:hypothetical protein n=1 Tax=Streptacidiphilus sp. MAP12-33 TaxID=3156266 RepID=UPI0035155039